MKLRDLGFDQWFEAHGSELHQVGRGIARISAVDRGSCLIRNETGEIPAELAGKLSYQVASSVDLPCVGDWELSLACRYADCSHTQESDCAVLAAIADGEVSEERYASYLKLRKESEHHEMSYLDKRKKDRAFGRFIKAAKKNMKK
ncbi:MAG: hypothetical protein ACYDAA_12405 [Syntrophales bacterium]